MQYEYIYHIHHIIYFISIYTILYTVGGPDYMKQKNILLDIADMTLEDFVLRTFDIYPQCTMIALKLPVNYHNKHLKDVVTKHNNHYNYTFYPLHKMTLTIIHR